MAARDAPTLHVLGYPPELDVQWEAYAAAAGSVGRRACACGLPSSREEVRRGRSGEHSTRPGPKSLQP